MKTMYEKFKELKKKHPDALILFRCGDFYETYADDATKASEVLGITLTKSSKTKEDDGKPMRMAGFHYNSLDINLPKLIRSGCRVAICAQLEAPNPTTKRGITETVIPQPKPTPKPSEPSVEDMVKAVREREIMEIKSAMGKLSTKSYRFASEEERPVVAGYWYDDPADLVVVSVIIDIFDTVKIECYGKEAGSHNVKYLLPEEFFPGQLTYVAAAIC